MAVKYPSFINWFKKNYPGFDPSTWQKQAETVAGGVIDPQEAAINRAIEAKKTSEEAFRQGGIGVQQALANLNAPLAGNVKQAYQEAADRAAGYARGLTGAVGQQAQSSAEQAAATLQRLGAPEGVPTQSPAAMNVANYVGGVLPANDLAAEAANRMGELTGLGQAGVTALANQTLAQMRATEAEITELRNQGLDLERTRPAEIAKALVTIRQQYGQDVATAGSMWSADQTARQQAVENQHWQKTFAATQALNKAKNAREQRAFELQIAQYNRSIGKDAWATAKQLSDDTGWVYTVKNGVPVRTNQHTVTWRKNQQQAAATRRANNIRQQDVNRKARQDAAKADKTKGTGGLTPNQVVIRENTWINSMTPRVDKIIGAVTTKNRITGATKTQPTRLPPPKAVIVRQVYGLVGKSMVGRIPRWTEQYLKSLIYSYVSTLPNRWWNPHLYGAPVKPEAQTPGTR